MSNQSSSTPLTRRRVIRGAAASSVFASFQILGTKKSQAADKKSGVVIGEGEHKYEVLHDWAQLPDKYTWQTTHNVAVDRAGNLYVIHEGRREQADHPSIFVFDPKGKFIKAFGKQFQGGGHGLEVRQEGKEEFLYVTGYQHLKNFAKLTLDGEQVWEQHAPMESGIYAEGEAEKPEKVWGRDRFLPTNFAFLDDGGFFLADGYGAWTIHRYDKDAKWVSCFGGPGKEDGKFQLPHGVWTDMRPGRKPSLVVADRTNGRVQWVTMEGKHIKTMDDFMLPANIDRFEDTLLIPDLSARITLVDKDDNLIHLGEDPEWRKQVMADGKKMRSTPDSWVSGKFVHPHDACFGANGDIFVAEWVASGRITKMRKVS